MDILEDYLEKVMGDMNTTWPDYTDLEAKKSGKPIQTYPIPFFGNIKNAQVLTVGVNPSPGEFDDGRKWPNTMTVNELNDRLQNYFVLEETRPHEWFNTWEQTLKPLDVSYKSDKPYLAAHLDLSPRATLPMSGAVRSGNGKLFIEMVKQDAQWFFELLPECNDTKLMLIAGSVTGRYYIDEFIECVAYRYGFKLEEPLTLRGEGFGFNRLRGRGIDIPVFFSSVSPSYTKKHELIDRVEKHRHELFDLMNKQADPATL